MATAALPNAQRSHMEKNLWPAWTLLWCPAALSNF
ncbi:hypothetical protein [Sporisorium scitamineum]|uniref:Uncharacterized protein n=1 Tax=Sporisorium scitamineum TaxID=49012 RepID=A0A0F7S3Y7_9BASI|nr:hypothetical protein [Sporisorium scitamineum]